MPEVYGASPATELLPKYIQFKHDQVAVKETNVMCPRLKKKCFEWKITTWKWRNQPETKKLIWNVEKINLKKTLTFIVGH